MAKHPWSDIVLPSVVLRPGGLSDNVHGHCDEEFWVPIGLASAASPVWDWLVHEEYTCSAPGAAISSRCFCLAHNSSAGRRVIVLDDCLSVHIRLALDICAAATAGVPPRLATPDERTLLVLARLATRCALTAVAEFVAKAVQEHAASDPLRWFVHSWLLGWKGLLPACCRLSYSPTTVQDPWMPIDGVADTEEAVLARNAFAAFRDTYRSALADQLADRVVAPGADGESWTIFFLDTSHTDAAYFCCPHSAESERVQVSLGDGTTVMAQRAFVAALCQLQTHLLAYPTSRTVVECPELREFCRMSCACCREEMKLDVHECTVALVEWVDTLVSPANVPFPDIDKWLAGQDEGKRAVSA
ncbi:hypothetical protein PsYK624_089380 [Phanerochaete sordida]|uniref:Uncharacterized protein n=1 Tax=Phanerochaete sordida TaxID=48140 RepID=A0A9P3GD95_9APHY|nr:hypothetical protein PsYK624_089380 [Phanerochaete sordida]